MPQKIKDLCPKILNPENQIGRLMIGHYGEEGTATSCKGIKQILKWVPDESQRIHAMIQDLRTMWQGRMGGRVVIFTNQRLQAGVLTNALIGQGFSCLHLHG